MFCEIHAILQAYSSLGKMQLYFCSDRNAVSTATNISIPVRTKPANPRVCGSFNPRAQWYCVFFDYIVFHARSHAVYQIKTHYDTYANRKVYLFDPSKKSREQYSSIRLVACCRAVFCSELKTIHCLCHGAAGDDAATSICSRKERCQVGNVRSSIFKERDVEDIPGHSIFSTSFVNPCALVQNSLTDCRE